MKFRIAGVALALLVFGLVSQSHACDCTLPQNYGNSQCRAAITAALNAKPGTNNANTNNNSNGQSQGQRQTQGQGQTATGGNSASNATGGTGGTGGSATGGKGGKATSASNSTSAGGSVSGVSAQTGASTASGGTANASGNGGSISEANTSSTYVAAARIPVNTAIAGFQMTTAPCRYAEGLGIQTMPAGGAVGFTFKDHDCMKLGLAQEFYSKGMLEAGDRIMCAIKEVEGVLGKECLMILTASHAHVTVQVQAPVQAPDTYTRAQVDAIVKKVVSK